MAKWTVNEGTQVAWGDELLPEGRTIFASPEEIKSAGIGKYVTHVNDEPEPEDDTSEEPKAKPAAKNKAAKASPNK